MQSIIARRCRGPYRIYPGIQQRAFDYFGQRAEFTGEQAKAFDVVVQIGAIAALCWALRARISAIVCGALARRPEAYRCAFNIALACAPAAALGLLFARPIKAALF